MPDFSGFVLLVVDAFRARRVDAVCGGWYVRMLVRVNAGMCGCWDVGECL